MREGSGERLQFEIVEAEKRLGGSCSHEHEGGLDGEAPVGIA